jgi:hypothetical protein
VTSEAAEEALASAEEVLEPQAAMDSTIAQESSRAKNFFMHIVLSFLQGLDLLCSL